MPWIYTCMSYIHMYAFTHVEAFQSAMWLASRLPLFPAAVETLPLPSLYGSSPPEGAYFASLQPPSPLSPLQLSRGPKFKIFQFKNQDWNAYWHASQTKYSDRQTSTEGTFYKLMFFGGLHQSLNILKYKFLLQIHLVSILMVSTIKKFPSVLVFKN